MLTKLEPSPVLYQRFTVPPGFNESPAAGDCLVMVLGYGEGMESGRSSPAVNPTAARRLRASRIDRSRSRGTSTLDCRPLLTVKYIRSPGLTRVFGQGSWASTAARGR